jgi:signal transduction histidine kinase
MDLQTLNIAQLLADVRDAFACQADELGVVLSVTAPDSLPALLADPQRIGQVLNNLVSNALRFTQAADEIVLGAAKVPDDSAVQLWVSDTGAGISAADLPRIFDRFWRGDPARSHHSGAGSGLGLAIARGLVEAHGGRIWAESQLGQGTIISCILPIIEKKI